MSPEDRPETNYMREIILWIITPIFYLNEEWNHFLSPPRQHEMRRHVIAFMPFLKGACVTFLLFTIITNVATAAVVSALVLIISLLVGILDQVRQLNRELPETRNLLQDILDTNSDMLSRQLRQRAAIHHARQDILDARQNVLDTDSDVLMLSRQLEDVRRMVEPLTNSGKKPTRARSPRRKP